MTPTNETLVGWVVKVRAKAGEFQRAEGDVEYVTRDGYCGVRERNGMLYEWPAAWCVPV